MNGILIIDKPQDVTSFDMVRQARRWCKTRRVGHAVHLQYLGDLGYTLLELFDGAVKIAGQNAHLSLGHAGGLRLRLRCERCRRHPGVQDDVSLGIDHGPDIAA